MTVFLLDKSKKKFHYFTILPTQKKIQFPSSASFKNRKKKFTKKIELDDEILEERQNNHFFNSKRSLLFYQVPRRVRS